MGTVHVHPEVAAEHHEELFTVSAPDGGGGATSDDTGEEICDYMAALEQMFRPEPGFGALAPQPQPHLVVAVAVPAQQQRWLDDGTSSDSDDAAASVLPLPIFSPGDDAILRGLQQALGLQQPQPHPQRRGESGGESDADPEFDRLGDSFGDDFFEYPIRSMAPAAAITVAGVGVGVPSASSAKSRKFTAPASSAPAGRAGKAVSSTPNGSNRSAKGNPRSRAAASVAAGGRALKPDPAFFPLDTRLLALFSDGDLRLGKPEWAATLKAARLDAAHEARAKKLRRTILSRRYAEDNRNKNKQQQKMTAAQRSALLTENDELRADNARLQAELQRARLLIAGLRR